MKAEEVNERFVKRLGRIIPKERYITLFEKVTEHTFQQNTKQQSSAADLLRNLPKYYQTATLPIKQKIIGSICSGKLVFAENDYRTMEFNDLIQGICKLGEHFDGLKKGQASISGSLSEEVTPIGLRSNLLLVDLERLSKIIVS